MAGRPIIRGNVPEPIGDIIAPSRTALDALLEQQEEAADAGALAYLARVMVQATMPHSRPRGNEFTRRNGNLTMTIMAPVKFGLPYGTIPRLLLAWITTEAVRTRRRELLLGPTLGSFMRELEMVPTGGRWGTIPRLRGQMRSLFAASISCSYTDARGDLGEAMSVARRYALWWDPKSPEQTALALWTSSVTLSEDFFEEITRHPIPVDLAALRTLKRSPMALDIYAWLTYRMSYLRKPATVPWELLGLQFGSEYTRPRAFREYFIRALGRVVTVYPAARVKPTEAGLLLAPSPTSIPRRGE